MLKKPTLNWENSWGFMVKIAVLEKLLGMRQVLKFNEVMDMNLQEPLFKNQTFNGDRFLKNSICD